MAKTLAQRLHDLELVYSGVGISAAPLGAKRGFANASSTNRLGEESLCNSEPGDGCM